MSIKTGYKTRWLMDEAVSTTLLDSSGNGLNATTSSALDSSFDNRGSARKVSGTSQGIYRTGVLSSYANFTISTMYKLSSINTASNTYTNAILGMTTGSANGIFIAISPNREISFYYYNGSAHLVSGSGIILNSNEWVHLSLTASNGVYRIYLNGVPIHTITTSHNVGLNFSTCYVNGSYNSVTYIYGSYDDIIIWESTLTDKEAFDVYKYYFKENRLLFQSNNNTYALEYKDVFEPLAMTSFTTPSSYQISSSGDYSSDYACWKAFDGKNATYADSWITISGAPLGWIQVNFGTSKVYNQLSFTTRNHTDSNTTAPKEFKILGSFDGVSWTELALIQNQTGWKQNETRVFEFNNSVGFQYYRVEITVANSTSYSAIGELIFGYKGLALVNIPSKSARNFSQYGATTLTNLNLAINKTNYVLQDIDSNTLTTKQLDKKPLGIIFN
ncbi:discoidin domain-containing protein [Lysinibacillus fusiformis]|uniref:LamG-like jellyroll fold domain-containing protein n=1 Tax=Lysinibacillus fusiformis TaxID=28031 RepID=UPI001F4D47FA|nr:LamG-like jellyroll fold domain-containing protein [Lysinibacillus fusiformis]MCK1987269.1 discoidin domain-containing protein [Lysinibacillus fusiformis]